jgi:hypothetical protein
MSLITRLRLAITALDNLNQTTPQNFGEGFDVLLTQDDNAIITQDERFIVIQTLQYELMTQAGFVLTTQDDSVIQAGY